MTKKTIGILGGMGPEATAHMYSLIIKHTKAEKDQDHIRIIIFNNPKIPPRTDAIFKNAPSPVPFLVEGVKILKQAGADFILIPCITAHYFLREVASQIEFEFLSLIEESQKWVLKKNPDLKKAGLIASTGTVESGLFANTFQSAGIEVIIPTKEAQNLVMDAISGKKGIKAGFTNGRLRGSIHRVAMDLIQKGAQSIIAGCTEVPLVLQKGDIPVPFIEPMEITARAAILKAGYPLKY